MMEIEISRSDLKHSFKTLFYTTLCTSPRTNFITAQKYNSKYNQTNNVICWLFQTYCVNLLNRLNTEEESLIKNERQSKRRWKEKGNR